MSVANGALSAFTGRGGFDLATTPRLRVLLTRYERFRAELSTPENRRAWPPEARKSGTEYCAQIVAEIEAELAARDGSAPEAAA